MTILDRSKVRSDVLKIMDAYLGIQLQVIPKFLEKEENKGVDFQALWKKVMDGNERFFKGENMSGFLTMDEQLFLTRFHRFGTEYGADLVQKRNPIPKDVKIEIIDANGVPAEWQIVPSAVEERVLLYLHGGGYSIGSPNDHRLLTVQLGRATKMRVLSVDYRLAPEYPHPAPLEDSITVYKWLLSKDIKPENIIIAGDSAGGNLTLVTLIKLRDDGISLPAGAFCLSPVTDYALTGESFFKNAERDVFLADAGLFWWTEAHLARADTRDPLVSPLFADLKGLPPLLIQASTSEMLYDDSRLFVERAKAAGVDATLEVWDDMMHVFQAFGLPESKEAITNISKFVKKLFI
ncbi:Acetyl esterase [subsurface metagenome]